MKRGAPSSFFFALGVLLLVTEAALDGAISDLSTSDPPTLYIQWLNSSASPMTDANGDLSTAANPFTGGAMVQLTHPVPKDVFLGVMINRLSGYDVTLTAGGGGATATTGRMTVTGGSPMTYTCSLTKVAGSFKGGTVADPSLDLTGSSKSATAVFVADADLPLQTTAPNYWRLTFTFPSFNTVADGLIFSGTYTGTITATAVIK